MIELKGIKTDFSPKMKPFNSLQYKKPVSYSDLDIHEKFPFRNAGFSCFPTYFFTHKALETA